MTQAMLSRLEDILREVLIKWRCTLVDFGGESDHVHLLIEFHPSLDISVLVNNIKTVSSRKIRAEFSEELAKFYWKPYFWSKGYAVKSACKGATVERLIEYFKQQEKPEK